MMQTTTIADNRVPAIAAWLGYSGLVPFVVLAAALWLLPDDHQPRINAALLAYAAIILSFMGAVHWGLAIVNESGPDIRQLSISVMPPLVAWFAGFTPTMINLALLIVSFAGLCVYDAHVAKIGKAPAWYPRLRIPLTLIVVTSLVFALLAQL